jgi:hypothetical protein
VALEALLLAELGLVGFLLFEFAGHVLLHDLVDVFLGLGGVVRGRGIRGRDWLRASAGSWGGGGSGGGGRFGGGAWLRGTGRRFRGVGSGWCGVRMGSFGGSGLPRVTTRGYMFDATFFFDPREAGWRLSRQRR